MEGPIPAIEGVIPIYWSAGVARRDVDRLVRVVNSAWIAVPADPREQIRRHWADHITPEQHRGTSNALTERQPRLRLSLGLNLPACSFYGHEIWYFTGSLAAMSDEQVRMAALHEFAHVTFHKEGQPSHLPLANPTQEEIAVAEALCEELVNQRLLQWGHDQSALQAWKIEWERINKIAPGG